MTYLLGLVGWWAMFYALGLPWWRDLLFGLGMLVVLRWWEWERA